MRKIIVVCLMLTGFALAQDFNELIAAADAKHQENEYSATYDLLKQAEQLEPENYEYVWRLARAHFDFADNSEDEDMIKENYYTGLEYAKKALELDENRAESHKWYGIMIGKVGIIEGSKQKILNSYKVKEHTLKAIELDPTDDGNYHVMGQWHFALSDLSWFERKIAGIIYATPPKASFAEAAEFFAKANEMAPDDVRHLLWLGKTYLKLKNKDVAREALNDAIEISANNESARILQKEAKELLSDL